ncbi:MAG: NifU family protein [Flavobacteriaceae bacterium]
MLKIETTNKDTIIKFVSPSVLTQGSFEYHNVDDAENSKLVQQLFYLPFVKKVFITANFIAVERFKIVEWSEVQTDLNQLISSFIETYGGVFNTEKKEQKIAIQVYAESTPNPNVTKFVSNKSLTRQLIELNRNDDSSLVPIAEMLFNFTYVKEIFINDNYISIAKDDTVDWFEITTELRSFIREYLQKNLEIVSENYISKTVQIQEEVAKETTVLNSISKEIIAVLDEYIKPAVTADGGNIMFKAYNEDSKTCSVVLQGACSGCPSATITLKNGIEATLKQILPGKIESVVAING